MSVASVVVVRSDTRGADATYRGICNTKKPGYGVLKFGPGGNLITREWLAADGRATVESLYTGPNACFRGKVYVNEATYGGGGGGEGRNQSLLPLRLGSHVETTDVSTFARAKSDEEGLTACDLHSKAISALRNDVSSKNEFRGVALGKEDRKYGRTSGLFGMSSASSSDYQSAFNRTENAHFVQLRGGLQHGSTGVQSDAACIQPKTSKWEERYGRAQAGFAAVKKMLRPGVSVAEANEEFMRHMDPLNDHVYGDVISHTGYASYENHFRGDPGARVEAYDLLRIGCGLGGAEAPSHRAILHEEVVFVKPRAESSAAMAEIGITSYKGDGSEGEGGGSGGSGGSGEGGGNSRGAILDDDMSSAYKPRSHSGMGGGSVYVPFSFPLDDDDNI